MNVTLKVLLPSGDYGQTEVTLPAVPCKGDTFALTNDPSFHGDYFVDRVAWRHDVKHSETSATLFLSPI